MCKNISQNPFYLHECKTSELRVDNASKLTKGETVEIWSHTGVQIQPSPAYIPQSNGSATRLVQEHWTRTRTLLFVSGLDIKFWSETIVHANRLRNRTLCGSIGIKLPILLWDRTTRLDFSQVPAFGQVGYAFIYESKTTPG